MLNKRQAKIVELVNNRNKISVAELSKKLKVSEVTIRKDLDFLQSNNLLFREHGYALKSKTNNISDNISIKYNNKKSIAKIAVDYVEENETIFIGEGSTCLIFAEELAKKKIHNRIITNSLCVASLLINFENIDVILLGGELNKNLKSTKGENVLSQLMKYKISKSFISADGYNKDIGFTAKENSSAEIIKEAIKISSTNIVLLDSSKLGEINANVICLINDINKFITNFPCDEEYINHFKEKNIDIVTD